MAPSLCFFLHYFFLSFLRCRIFFFVFMMIFYFFVYLFYVVLFLLLWCCCTTPFYTIIPYCLHLFYNDIVCSFFPSFIIMILLRNTSVCHHHLLSQHSLWLCFGMSGIDRFNIVFKTTLGILKTVQDNIKILL